MAHPRQILPQQTYLITRRCYQRTFRLRPCPQTTAIFGYCLALAMHKTGVLLHAACVMSDHHHLIVTDPRGLLPDFLRELHRLTAKAMNASQGQWENLWAVGPCNIVRLVTADDVIDKIAYVVANPVTAGLVQSPRDWPGFLVWQPRSTRVTRPSVYFRSDGVCPPELELPVVAPGADDEAAGVRPLMGRVARAIEARVEAARRALRAAGRAFLDPQAMLRTSFIERASSYEKKRGAVPTFAAQLGSVRARLSQIERDFRRQYRAALERWRTGDRGVAFPAGTWQMRVTHGAFVEAAVAA